MYDLLIIGGGASGFFCAIHFAEKNPGKKILILEAGKDVLSKVRISGGGRCNVTHACFDPKELVQYYPRGGKELLGSFIRFGPSETVEWFESHGIELKTEEDGRMFPLANTSEVIIKKFVGLCHQHHIEVQVQQRAISISRKDGSWVIQTRSDTYTTEQLFIGSGSDQRIWDLLAQLGHHIIQPVPSLFTFNIKDKGFNTLSGISVENASCDIVGTNFHAEGPLLITHWGVSGPAVLKLSAWAARYLFDCDYQFSIQINWLLMDSIDAEKELIQIRLQHQSKVVQSFAPFPIALRLWKYLCNHAGIDEQRNWNSLSIKDLRTLGQCLCKNQWKVESKTTFKQEFVTAGGIDLKEIDFKKFKSLKAENLYLAGEVLNIDALTGGFNFQAAWTGAYLAAEAIALQNNK